MTTQNPGARLGPNEIWPGKELASALRPHLPKGIPSRRRFPHREPRTRRKGWHHERTRCGANGPGTRDSCLDPKHAREIADATRFTPSEKNEKNGGRLQFLSFCNSSVIHDAVPGPEPLVRAGVDDSRFEADFPTGGSFRRHSAGGRHLDHAVTISCHSRQTSFEGPTSRTANAPFSGLPFTDGTTIRARESSRCAPAGPGIPFRAAGVFLM